MIALRTNKLLPALIFFLVFAMISPAADAGLHFTQPERRLPHVPEKFPFPTAGDLRWRPFFADSRAEHISLLRLYDGDEKYLGDAVAYSELNGGGKILYVCFNLLEGHYSEPLLYDVFDFIAARIGR